MVFLRAVREKGWQERTFAQFEGEVVDVIRPTDGLATQSKLGRPRKNQSGGKVIEGLVFEFCYSTSWVVEDGRT